MLRKTIVNVIESDGTIKYYCEFLNEFTHEYNMITLCMKENKIGNLSDSELRKQFEKEVIKSGKHIFFESNEKVYITKI